MEHREKPVTILMADDDPDDCMLVKEAFEESRLDNDLRCVEDGNALMDYLYRRGKFNDIRFSPLPSLILLDLNMPKKDGREALKEIKTDPGLRDIPVVVLTTSKEESDIIHAYNLGANSFIIKPETFQTLIEIIRSLGKYWFDTVELPSREKKELH